MFRLLNPGNSLPSCAAASLPVVLVPFLCLVLSKQLTVKGALDRSPETWVRVLVLSRVSLVALGQSPPSLGLGLSL